MAFDPKPVSLEEYNQSLRDSVNAYYTHAVNDPSMSKEEAISSAAQMSESYLSAVEEFQEAQSMECETVPDDSLQSEETEAGENSGEDNGLDGGEDCDDGLDL